MHNRFPTFIVIGAPKSGTTSLYHYLRQHPDVFLPKQKELHYFSFPDLVSAVDGPGDSKAKLGWCETWDQYCSYYYPPIRHTAIGEISPSYLYHSRSAERIFDKLGSVKIVAILRNPIEKAYSQYMHQVRDGWEPLSFPAALASESTRRALGWGDIWRYSESSLYAERLAVFRDVFGPDHFRIFLFDDLQRSPSELMKEIFSYLGVDPDVVIDTKSIFNRSGESRLPSLNRLLLNPGLIKSFCKPLIPNRLGATLRNALMTLNTKSKSEMPSATRQLLFDFFYNDIIRLENNNNIVTGWLDQK